MRYKSSRDDFSEQLFFCPGRLFVLEIAADDRRCDPIQISGIIPGGGRSEGGATFLLASEGSCLSSCERSGTRAPAAE